MNIAPYIDHTILKQETTTANVIQLCAEAVDAGFKAVCIPPFYVTEAVRHLKDTGVKVATVIGFPFGYSLSAMKAEEAELAMMGGADELDMVINIGALKSGNSKLLESEIGNVLEVVKLRGKVIKVIVESGILTDQELEQVCQLYSHYDIDFMKTSTGFAATGATVKAVQTMRKLLPERIAIKASGGIRTYAFAKELIDAGATRLGCSAGLQIVAESHLS